MVAFTREAWLAIRKATQKPVKEKVAQPVPAERSPLTPAKCWIITRGRSIYTCRLAEDWEFLLVFSTRKAALRFLRNRGQNPAKWNLSLYDWDVLVKDLGSMYDFVLLDDTGLDAQNYFSLPLV